MNSNWLVVGYSIVDGPGSFSPESVPPDAPSFPGTAFSEHIGKIAAVGVGRSVFVTKSDEPSCEFLAWIRSEYGKSDGFSDFPTLCAARPTRLLSLLWAESQRSRDSALPLAEAIGWDIFDPLSVFFPGPDDRQLEKLCRVGRGLVAAAAGTAPSDFPVSPRFFADAEDDARLVLSLVLRYNMFPEAFESETVGGVWQSRVGGRIRRSDD